MALKGDENKVLLFSLLEDTEELSNKTVRVLSGMKKCWHFHYTPTHIKKTDLVRKFSCFCICFRSLKFRLKATMGTSVLLVNTSPCWFCQHPNQKFWQGWSSHFSEGSAALGWHRALLITWSWQMLTAAHLIGWQLRQHLRVVSNHLSN